MNKIAILIISVLISSISLQAQDIKEFVDQNYCIYQDGAVLMYTKGMPKQLKESYTLKNGTVVNSDGSYMLKNNKKFQLKDGECLGYSGHKYKNEQQLFSKQQAQKKKALKKKKTKRKY